MCVCGEASASAKGLRQIEGMAPDVAILDISLKDAHLLEHLQASVPETKVLVYSMQKKEDSARQAAQADGYGYVEKSAPIGKTIEKIRTLARGTTP